MTGFVTKKIGRKQNLGKMLKSARSRANLTIEQAEKETKICVKYLQALEDGNYKDLPAEAYNIGFVRAYAKFLKLNQEKVIQLYREERSSQHFAAPENSVLLQPKKTKDWQFLITPKLLAVFGTILLFGGVTLYIWDQLNNFRQPPELAITNVPNEFTSSKDTVTIAGNTAAGATLSVNSEPIIVQSDGSFSQAVQLNPGVNDITFLSRNRAQKEAAKTVKVLYNPDLAKASESVTKE